jgi:hypothetical protein
MSEEELAELRADAVRDSMPSRGSLTKASDTPGTRRSDRDTVAENLPCGLRESRASAFGESAGKIESQGGWKIRMPHGTPAEVGHQLTVDGQTYEIDAVDPARTNALFLTASATLRK